MTDLTRTEGKDSWMLSRRQFIFLSLIISIPFKLAELPSVLSSVAGNDALFSIAFIMLMDLLIAYTVLYIVEKGGISNIATGFFKVVLYTLIFSFIFIKIIIYTTILVDYVAGSMFDNIDWFCFLFALIPLAFTLGNKALYVLGRLAQVCLWIALFAILFNLIFFSAELETSHLLPLGLNGIDKIAISSTRGFWLIGDTLPLVFGKIKVTKNDIKKGTAKALLVLLPIAVIAFYCLSFMIYGVALPKVSNVFSRLALFNKISEQLGAIDFPIIIAWISCAVTALGIKAFALKSVLGHTKTAKGLYVLTGIGVFVIMQFFVKNYEQIEKVFLLSPITYAGAMVFVLVITALVMMLKARKKCEEGTDEQSKIH